MNLILHFTNIIHINFFMAQEEKSQTTPEQGKKKDAKKSMVKEVLPELRPGMTVKVYQKIKEESKGKEKERLQAFEGIIISYRRRNPGPTITVRKISEGVGVEKIFPVLSPNIIRIVPVKQAKVRRAKLYYLRDYSKRLKEVKIK